MMPVASHVFDGADARAWRSPVTYAVIDTYHAIVVGGRNARVMVGEARGTTENIECDVENRGRQPADECRTRI